MNPGKAYTRVQDNLTMIKLKISSNTIISIVIIAGAIISYFLLVNFIL